jgi:hypothetical protein
MATIEELSAQVVQLREEVEQLRGQIANAGVNALAAAPSGYYMLKYSGEEIDTKLGKI